MPKNDNEKIIESSKRKKNFKIHSATKVFQALRIFVNKEISELIYGLINAVQFVSIPATNLNHFRMKMLIELKSRN